MTRGRPLAFNPDQATEAAMRVFWASGYEAASTRELLDAMGISRSSLYQAYGNKEQLFLEALRRYRERLFARLEAQLEAAPRACDFLAELFQGVAEDALDPERAALGCLIFNSASELGRRDDPPARQAAAGVAAIQALLAKAIRRAQAEGDIPAERDPVILADYLTLSIAGLRTLIKAGTPASRARAVAERLLDGLRS